MLEIPYGFCECGCGKKTAIAPRTAKKLGHVKGQPVRFVSGHNAVRHPHGWKKEVESRDGFCECGCAQKAPLAKTTSSKAKHIKGKPLRFIHGHHMRKSAVLYVVEDRGYKTPCWIWQGCRVNGDYGLVQVNGTRQMAHRFFYEAKHGNIPDGLEADHLCMVKPCVNPDHVEPVTHIENMRRARTAQQTQSLQSIK